VTTERIPKVMSEEYESQHEAVVNLQACPEEVPNHSKPTAGLAVLEHLKT